MLTHLSIRGLAIIESLNIEFARGFNVITGETGAGKSILIKALSLLLGAKASHDAVRMGFDHATVSGRFVVRKDHPALKLLADWGVTTEDDEHGHGVIIRRQVTAKGRSSAWINDIPVTTTSLKELAETLIDVFGQHDNQRLFDVAFHTHYLDQFIHDKSLPDAISTAWHRTSDIFRELREFVDEIRGRGRDVDYLSFRLKELTDFAPEAADYMAVRSLSERAKASLAISTAIQRANSALEDETGLSLARRLREVSRYLASAKIAELDQLAMDAIKVAESIDDLSFGLGKAASHVDFSEDDVDQAEERVAGYQDLFRKHSVSGVEDLEVEWEKLKQQVAAIEDASGHVNGLLSRLREHVGKLMDHARILTSQREDALAVICARVEQELADLAMPGAKFTVELEPVIKPAASLDLGAFGQEATATWGEIMEDWTCVQERGAERAQFYLASNAGEPSLPLAKIASGGEVSRIMLALKKALVVGAETCVLVFDEIDSGISGRIADTVGQKIAELAGFCQIICISHLPQVAAYAKTHYIVEKRQKGDRTESNIRPLDVKERFEEVARLLSGNHVTETSLSHAKGLIEDAHEKLNHPKGQKFPLKNALATEPSNKPKAPAIAAAKRNPKKSAISVKKHGK